MDGPSRWPVQHKVSKETTDISGCSEHDWRLFEQPRPCNRAQYKLQPVNTKIGCFGTIHPIQLHTSTARGKSPQEGSTDATLQKNTPIIGSVKYIPALHITKRSSCSHWRGEQQNYPYLSRGFLLTGSPSALRFKPCGTAKLGQDERGVGRSGIIHSSFHRTLWVL